MAESRVSHYVSRLKDMEREKEPHIPLLQALAESFLMRKADFTNAGSPGEFIHDNTFDNTGQFAAYVFASVCLSMIWPDASRTINILPVRQLRKKPGVESYFRDVTTEMHLAMDRTEAGLSLSLMEHFLDQGVFGLSGVATWENKDLSDLELPAQYEAWDVKAMCISRNAQGFVDTIYARFPKTVKQVYEEYGTGRPGDRVSAHIVEKYKARKYDEIVQVLKVLEPKVPEKGKKGIAGMKVRSVHVDVDNKTIMRESAYEEMPVSVATMFKRLNEMYGRSCGGVALPFAVSLNALAESVLVAAEKQLDPPLAVSSDARLGGGVIDTSAGAINVVDMSGHLGQMDPIKALFTVGESQSVEKVIEALKQSIMQSFFLDRLLDLNNKTMMTAYETSVRNRLRGEATGSVFARQYQEVIDPTVKRTFNIMFRRGHFGWFPGMDKNSPGLVRRAKWKELTGQEFIEPPEIVRKAVAAGLDVYDIEYISPAKRFMQAEKLQGLFTALDAVAALAPTFPDIIHKVEIMQAAEDIYKLGGAPMESLRTKDDADASLAAAAERQNAAMMLEAGKGVAQIKRDSAQATASMAGPMTGRG